MAGVPQVALGTHASEGPVVRRLSTGDEVTNVVVAGHGNPTLTGAKYGPIAEAEIARAATFVLHTPRSGLALHMVDVSIIGAHPRRAQEALYGGINGPTSHFGNQHALIWSVDGLCRRPRRVGGGGGAASGGTAQLALGRGPA